MQQQNSSDAYFNGVGVGVGGGGTSSLMFPEVSPMLPWTLVPPQVHNLSSIQTFPNYTLRDHHDPFLLPPSPSMSLSPYGGLFNRRQHGLQFPIYADGSSSDHLSLLSETCLSQVVQSGGGSAPFGLQAELQKMSAQEIMDAKALAASKSHSEAERRRRERINNHLAKLRSLLPNTTKTDKASLLAEVIQHLKELKRQTSSIAESSPIPTEMDELIVDNIASDEQAAGKVLIKASFCCEDRTDLLTDLIKTLKALRLRTLKAEIATLGGRVKNVLFITGEDEEDETINGHDEQMQCTIISSIKEALKAVMEKAAATTSTIDESGLGNIKRQRTNTLLQHI